MKILLVNNDKGWSGGQEHLKDLATELLRRGIDVHFVVRAGSKSDLRFRELDVPVYALPTHGFGDAKALLKLISIMRRERFDIISVNREHDLLLTALAWRLAFPLCKRSKFMMSYHTATTRRQHLLSTANGILCISEHVKTQLLKSNPRFANRVSIVHYGIALSDAPTSEKFNPDRQRRFFPNVGFPLIGMVGEFWKNQEELVDMLPLLRKSFPNLKLAFVGDNTDLGLITPLMEKIRLLKLQDVVIFTGRIPRERIPDVFYDFDISVTTHRNEGFGIVHLESMAAGTPVITYDQGGMVDIFKGENVGVVVSGGANDFTAAIVRLLKDHSLRFSMGKCGYELMQRTYTLSAMGDRYLAFYRKLLGQNLTGSR